jgi:hypothetical protein
MSDTDVVVRFVRETVARGTLTRLDGLATGVETGRRHSPRTSGASHPPREAERPVRSRGPRDRCFADDGQGAGNGVTGKPGGGAPDWITPMVSSAAVPAGMVVERA